MTPILLDVFYKINHISQSLKIIVFFFGRLLEINLHPPNYCFGFGWVSSKDLGVVDRLQEVEYLRRGRRGWDGNNPNSYGDFFGLFFLGKKASIGSCLFLEHKWVGMFFSKSRSYLRGVDTSDLTKKAIQLM